MVQNAALRLLTRTSKHEHITPVCASSHWLSVHFKFYCFKVLSGLAPTDLAYFVQIYKGLSDELNSHSLLSPHQNWNTEMSCHNFRFLTTFNAFSPGHFRRSTRVSFKSVLASCFVHFLIFLIYCPFYF